MKKANPSSAIADDFEAHLKAKGLASSTVEQYLSYVRRFLTFVGNGAIDCISQQQTADFFKGVKKEQQKQVAMCVSQFLTFTMAQLPVVVNKAGGAIPPPVRKLNKKELALRDKWTLDKMQAEAERKDKIIARLARPFSKCYTPARCA